MFVKNVVLTFALLALGTSAAAKVPPLAAAPPDWGGDKDISSPDNTDSQSGLTVTSAGILTTLFHSDLVVTRSLVAETFGENYAASLDAQGFLFLPEGGKKKPYWWYPHRSLGLSSGVRWPNRVNDVATIAFRFDNGGVEPMNEERREAARAAHAVLERSGVVRFVEQTTEAEFFNIGVYDLDTCYSRLGFDPNSPDDGELNLGWCNSMDDLGSIVHEHLHTLGFWHEQTRPDRDDFIEFTVAPEDVPVEDRASAVNNWRKADENEVDSLGSPYDFASVMHYFDGAFSVRFVTQDGVTLPGCLDPTGIPDLSDVGQREDPSASDIEQLRLLYQCVNGPRTGPVPLEDFCTTNCPCWEQAIGDCDSDDECQGELVCGGPIAVGPEGWFCEEAGNPTLPENMCITNSAAPVAVCQAAEVPADNRGMFPIANLDPEDIDGGSSDADQHVNGLELRILTTGDLTLGDNTVTLEVADSGGRTDTCQAVVTVVDQTPPSGKNIFCFSAANKVEVEGKGFISMGSLKIGDKVRAGKDEFSTVYSFLHLDRDVAADFLQVHAEGLKTPLEITPDHMLFVKSALFPVPASQVKIGDKVKGEHKVSDIMLVKRRGVFAPATESGEIVVSGMLASSYADLLPHSFVNQHHGAHAFFGLRRLVCAFDFGICENETYTETGIPEWLSLTAQVATSTKDSAVAQILLSVIGLPVLAAAFMIEKIILSGPIIVGMIALLGLLAVKKTKTNKSKAL